MKKHKRIKILRALIVLTVIFIWAHSFMPPDMSGEESGFVVSVLELAFGKGNVSELLVRKLAHFTEYFILGMELMAYFGVFHTGAFHGLTVAAIDETIQLLSQRGSSLLDVWLDFAGCLTGILIILLITGKKHTKKE